jgi:hypothetical protein
MSNDRLVAAVRVLRDAATEVTRPGGWENLHELDAAIAHNFAEMGADDPGLQRHLSDLKRIVLEKCEAWLRERKSAGDEPVAEDARLAVHQDAEDLVRHCDILLAAVQPDTGGPRDAR